MRISEYIRELEDFKKQNGDLEMLIGGRDGAKTETMSFMTWRTVSWKCERFTPYGC